MRPSPLAPVAPLAKRRKNAHVRLQRVNQPRRDRDADVGRSAIHETATISTMWPAMPCFSNLVLFDPLKTTHARSAGSSIWSRRPLDAQPRDEVPHDGYVHRNDDELRPRHPPR